MKKTLLLLPNLLCENGHHQLYLPPSVDKAVASLDGLIAESERAGRRYLSRFLTEKDPASVPIAVYDDKDLDFLLQPILKGERWGFVSDAGLPCIADPGHKLVHRARQLGISIQPFVGPSSIMIALMMSGLPAQRFMFLGYLAKEELDREKEILQIEKRSRQDKATQVFIEAPYRNQETLESCLKVLADDTVLSCVWEIHSPDQGILVAPVSEWKKQPRPNIKKKNAIFLISA